jgi:hypothetical protein
MIDRLIDRLDERPLHSPRTRLELLRHMLQFFWVPDERNLPDLPREVRRQDIDWRFSRYPLPRHRNPTLEEALLRDRCWTSGQWAKVVSHCDTYHEHGRRAFTHDGQGRQL